MNYITRNIRNFLSTYLKEKYFIHFTAIFLIALCFNIDNKTIILASFVYLIISSIILRSFSKGLIFAFLLFQLFLVGKTFEYEFIPASRLAYGKNLINYPGYYQYITLSSKFFIGIIMMIWGMILIIQKKIKFDKYTQIFLLYILLSFISAILSINYQLSLFYWFSDLPLFFIFCLLKKEMSNNNKFIYTILQFFSMIVIYEGVISILQYLTKSPLLPNLIFIKEFINEGIDLDPNWFRPWGTLIHPNDLANFFLPSTIVFLLIGFMKSVEIKKYIFIGLIFGLLGLTLTLSRSSWITLFIVETLFVYYLEKIRRYRFDSKYLNILIKTSLLIIPLIMIIAIPRISKSFLSFTTGGSGQFRLDNLKEPVNLITKYPIFGVGQGMSTLGMFLENPKGDMYYFPTPPHNIFLYLTTELGLIPVFLFFFLILILISSKTKKTSIIDRSIFLAPIFCILINGFFQPIYSTTMIYLIIYATIFHFI